MSEVTVIIPARWASTRFPGKPLVKLRGKPLVQHVWERANRAKRVGRIIIATDDMRIAEAAFDFGAEVALTSPKHPTGTDRLAEVVQQLKSASIILNVQGDEPDIAPSTIDRLVEALQDDPKLGMVTAANPLADPADVQDPNVVKVVADLAGRALCFSPHFPPAVSFPMTATAAAGSGICAIKASTVTAARCSSLWSNGNRRPSSKSRSLSNCVPWSMALPSVLLWCAVVRSGSMFPPMWLKRNAPCANK
jgi:CMP-2-keto-3-deoxyoctulosonic acid synthetase